MRWLVAAILMMLGLARAEPLPRATIVSSWHGKGTPRRERLVVTDATAVRRLIDAVAAPLRVRPDALDLGVTPAWIAANERKLVAGARARERDAVLAAARDPKHLQLVLDELYRARWTDDEPAVEVTIERAGAPPLVLRALGNTHSCCPGQSSSRPVSASPGTRELRARSPPFSRRGRSSARA